MIATSSDTLAALGAAECGIEGGLEQAADELERAIGSSADAPLLHALGALRLLLSHDAKAHHYLRLALCADPSDVLCRHLYALSLWRIGRRHESAAQLRICLESAAFDVDVLMALSVLAREIGEIEEACRTQDRALQHHSRDADVWTQAGSLAWSLGQKTTAIRAYRAALELDPKHTGARVALNRIASATPA